MKALVSIPFLFCVSCEDTLQQSYDKAMEDSADIKLRSVTTKTASVSLISSPFVTESVKGKLAGQIVDSLVKFSEIQSHPQGFQKIDEVEFTWLNIAGVHSRRAEYGDYFLFPRLDVAEEDNSWQSGIALKRGSRIAYRWRLENYNAEQGSAHQSTTRPESESE